ncbi:ExeA family protein [Wenzhouxiangella sp. XN24]|uniref:ExeA family protein n=1 Tax=Wenzhouxiangella sp. XN24 TaxID=2713569 RepID=UPI0013EB628A|nr:ExeA family protein [Wenzhouxiangella sp. XN24]NGX17290.1 AAA family ATPase [Wenzhouxiangella sp. XN24]
MYASFFGLNEKPFSITPDPRYLYLGRRHAEALAHLLYGITESGGFIQLTGEVGTGKTTVVRSLLEQLPEHAEVALVLNPRLSPAEFLLTICEELHVEVPDRSSPKAVVDALNRHLLEAHAAGRRVVLIVDEAQNLSADVLEQIRLLTNLETAKQKLLQIILIGQPELREVLARSDLRQLAQRITGRYHLEPLEADELRAYVRHRLEVAGSRAELFTPGAVKALHHHSGGVPRLVNVIADRALLGAWAREETVVSPAMARKAASEVFGEPRRRSRRRVPLAALLMLGIALAILAGVGTALLREHFASPAGISTVQSTGVPEAANSRAMVPASGAAPVPALGLAEPARDDEPGGASAAGIAPVSADDAGPATPDPAAMAHQNPAAESVPVRESAPPLAERLALGELATGTDQAFTALLGRWQLTYRPTAGPACEQVAAQGLQCLLQRGTWGELAALNRPAILVLSDRDGREHQLVLNRVSDGMAELVAGQQAITVPLGELLTLWFGEYLLLWRAEAGDGRVLARGATGTDVLWLRRVLGELRGAPVLPADSRTYDPGLEAAVREFQRSRRLAADGIAGAMTLISVNEALDLPGRERLQDDT